MAHTVNKYPDKTSYVNKVSLKCDPFKINSYEDLWHLNQYVDAFKSQHGISPNILIPNLIDAQADRRFNEGESSGLKLVCEFLNSMDVKQFHIFHPHNPEVVEALIDNVNIIDNSEFIEKVLSKLGIILKKDEPILMSSDAGGFKPLMKLCEKINWEGETFSASKARKWTDEGSKLTQIVDREDFGGKNILIIDDLSIGGGTFKGLSTTLKKKNVGKLYLAVSHMTLEDLGNDPITNYFDKVFTTNSKFDNYYARGKAGGWQPENLEIIKLF